MSHEIYYTSAPEGMKRGSSGFSTVGATEGIPKALWDRLEALSAYRHHFGVASAEGGGASGQNPISFAHCLLSVTGTTYHVLSRICDSGVDHTQRSNAFAHHVVVNSAEMAAAQGGPAWMLQNSRMMESAWDGRVGAIGRNGGLPQGDSRGGVCRAWGALTGDAGWGGVLADSFIKTPTKPICILFAPGQELLPLLAETIALLPPAARWNVTFNTYFTSMPTSATCAWRCCLAGTPASQVGLRYAANGIVLDLTDLSRLKASGNLIDGPCVRYARTGEPPPESKPVSTPPKPPASAPKSGAKPVGITPAAAVGTMEADEEDEEIVFEPDLNVAPESPGTPSSEPPVANVHHRQIVRKRQLPNIRIADQALRTAEGDASKAAARRRKQVLMLFGGALAAIALAMILVKVVFYSDAPVDLPPVPRSAVHSPPTVAPANVAPVAVTPQPPATEPVVPKAPSVDTSNAILVPTPAAIVPPPAAAVQIVPRFPALLTLASVMEAPAPGQGEVVQSILVPPNDYDAGAKPTGMRLRFPAAGTDSGGSTSEFPYKDGITGTVTATASRFQGLSVVTVSWKDATGVLDVVDIKFDPGAGRHPEIGLTWKSSALLKNPDVARLVFWLVDQSTLELLPGRAGEAGQKIVFRQTETPAIPLANAAAPLKLPPLPNDLAVIAPEKSGLPEGWEATWYTDWDEKNASLRTAANATQVVKFHKSTGVAAGDAWFLVRFGPGFQSVENTFAKQAEAAAAGITDGESDLRDIDRQIEQAKRDSGGKLPDTDSARLLQKKRDDTAALVDAYKAAVNGYNDIHGFDIQLSLPGGVRLATVKFSRDK